jgi:hypothetical protein
MCVHGSAVGDATELDAAFGKVLGVAARSGVKDHYVVLVDYADGLLRLGRPECGPRFEETSRYIPSTMPRQSRRIRGIC